MNDDGSLKKLIKIQLGLYLEKKRKSNVRVEERLQN